MMIRSFVTVTSLALVLVACSDETKDDAKTDAPVQPAVTETDTLRTPEA
jgi:PBP1b-binding outer membrane lipoprotein LpoB